MAGRAQPSSGVVWYAMKLRILHVVFSLAPGGLENGIVNVANGLDPARFEVHVCCLEQRGEFADRLPQPGNVTVLHKRPGKSLRAAYGLLAVLLKLRPHVVHSHNLGPLIYSVLATAGGCLAPVLQGEHGTFPAEELTPQRLRQRQRLYRHCRYVHTVSDGLRDYLAGLQFPAAKLRSIVNGVDTARFVPGDRRAVRAALGLPVDAVVLGIVGRLVKSKRHDVLFEAAAQLADCQPPVHVLVVGDGGAEQAQVRAWAAQSPVAARLHLAGFQADPRPCYQALDLLVVPSAVEGLSNAVLEAMACGVPVYSNEVCGSREIITHGHDGLLGPMHTAADLAGELRPLLADPARLAALGAAARATALQRLSLAAMVRGYAELYEEVAGVPPR